MENPTNILPFSEPVEDEFTLPTDEEFDNMMETALGPQQDEDEDAETIPSGPVVECCHASCPYCGKTMFVEGVGPDAPEGEKDELAIKFCDCKEAKNSVRIKTMYRRIELLFGKNSAAAYGFSEEFDDMEIEKIKAIGRRLLAGDFMAITATLLNGEKVSFTTVKDEIKVKRTANQKAEAKV